MASLYKGNAPKDGALVAITPDGRWSLYVRGAAGRFVNLKLVASDRAPGKANYWLVGAVDRPYLLSHGRFKDGALLYYHRPRLAEWAKQASVNAARVSRGESGPDPVKWGQAIAQAVGYEPDGFGGRGVDDLL